MREILNKIASKTVLQLQREGWTLVPKTYADAMSVRTYRVQKNYGSYAAIVTEWTDNRGRVYHKAYIIQKINGAWYYR